MPCVLSDGHGHVEGRLHAVVVEENHRGSRLLATYMIESDASGGSIATAVEGTLEDVPICHCI